ncbi:MAG: MBOAT family protein [Clostridia bacterium]|nr:MBOAT family protein [Clostridia bacterium]
MSFNSVSFLIFVCVSVILYYLVPKRIQWFTLFISGMFYYIYSCKLRILYLFFTGISVYAFALILDKLNDRKSILKKEKNAKLLEKNKRQRKLAVFFCCIANLGLLYFLKYWNFTVDIFTDSSVLKFENIIMPLGVSFFIFQSIGYTVDVYRGKYKAQRNIFKFLLFVSFFPQMVQGPISRYNDLAPELYAERKIDFDNIRFGIQRIMWGYFKKIVIADRAGVAVDAIMKDVWSYSGSVKAFSILMYCIQLYCDFSGGIDITVGVAQLFGIRLTENFKRPIFAHSLTEFWRRWHITLGAWMRDYVFYPLSLSKPFAKLGRFTRKYIKGKAGKIIPTSAATFIIYFLIGIWHGANFRYIAFGFWNGALITASLLLESVFIKVKAFLHIDSKKKWYRAFMILRTCFIVFIGRYITRAPRLKTAVLMIKDTFLDFNFADLRNNIFTSFGLMPIDYLVILLGVILILVIEFKQERGIEIRSTLAKQNSFVQWLAIFIPLVILFLFGVLRSEYISASFLYQVY